MTILKKSLLETLKIFIFSAICSVIFYLLISSENALSDTFVCTFLNSAALLLFLCFEYRSWARVYEDSSDALEYFVPVLTSFLIYAILSGILYACRFFLYMWIFLPTRFLEPQLSVNLAPLSIWVTYVFMAILVFVTPILYTNRK